MTDTELDMIIDWCRKKIADEKCPHRLNRLNSRTFDGYEIAMKAVMSYLHSLKKANNEKIQVITSEIIELANIIAERPCDSKDCAPCIHMGRRCNDYLKAERAIEAGYRKQSEAEWISVEERMPDCEQGAESKAVLFITKQGFMYTGYYGCGGIYHDRYFREYKNSTEGYDISSVTHWMPLPEPPVTKGV